MQFSRKKLKNGTCEKKLIFLSPFRKAKCNVDLATRLSRNLRTSSSETREWIGEREPFPKETLGRRRLPPKRHRVPNRTNLMLEDIRLEEEVPEMLLRVPTTLEEGRELPLRDHPWFRFKRNRLRPLISRKMLLLSLPLLRCSMKSRQKLADQHRQFLSEITNFRVDSNKQTTSRFVDF